MTPPPLPLLYSFRRCPYAMRARLALLAAGQACELREVVLRDKPQALRNASPKATVPVLVLADGQVIDESLAIMQWALARHDPLGWGRPSEATPAQMLELVAANDTQFKPLLDRYKYPERHGEPDGTAARQACLPFLMALQARLQAGPFLCGGHATLADAALAPFVRQFAGVAPDWFAAQPWPALRQWLDGWQQSALFASAMRRLPPWQPGDAPTVFGPDEP
ncbi:glutathione S-transferase [Pseudorhodoferax sp. Leaf274]|uniref:glutathione S-transferase n=1 Tax=Pseudorhodoferax sp. Leaf274 TaxID=1736318 RepID=UPI000702F07A|nr:glutathione S-transferase [Pseudorhodoferax sp. Leaf274]KQP35578.1 glutathione S-transferase [Pseudorhodoferax sp. Leaf274]